MTESMLERVAATKRYGENLVQILQQKRAQKAVVDDAILKINAQLQQTLGTDDWDEAEKALAQSVARFEEAYQNLIKQVDNIA